MALHTVENDIWTNLKAKESLNLQNKQQFTQEVGRKEEEKDTENTETLWTGLAIEEIDFRISFTALEYKFSKIKMFTKETLRMGKLTEKERWLSKMETFTMGTEIMDTTMAKGGSITMKTMQATQVSFSWGSSMDRES